MDIIHLILSILSAPFVLSKIVYTLFYYVMNKLFEENKDEIFVLQEEVPLKPKSAFSNLKFLVERKTTDTGLR